MSTATSAATTVVLACDDHYASHAAVVLQSLLRWTPQPPELLLLSNLSELWAKRLQRLADSHGTRLQLVPMKELLQRPELEQLASKATATSVPHASASALARLLAGQLLAPHCQRALYLDCDLLVQGDLTPLLNHPLNGKPLAAAADVLLTRMPHQRLRFPGSHTYINSGVLLLDLERWRELELDNAALAIAADPRLQGQLLYPDQDVLNLIGLRFGIESLGTRWNHQLIHGAHTSLASEDDPQGPPAIVHFAGEVKPWKSWYPDGPARRAYWSCRHATDPILGFSEPSQADPPQTPRDHWLAFHLLHRHQCYEQASHCAAALFRGLPAPQP